MTLVPLSSLILTILSMKNKDSEVNMPATPTSTKNSEDFLNPACDVYELSIRYPVKIGTTHSARLDIISMIPKAVPNTFFLTTNGMVATTQLA